MTAEWPAPHLQEPPSRLPEGGLNLFQGIKEDIEQAKKGGIEIISLSIGEPDGWPFDSAIVASQQALGVRSQDMHGYQDNGERGVPGFSRKFVQAHVRTPLNDNENLAFLPTTGTKPMLTLFSFACGGADRKLTVAMMTDPGYPTPKDWADDLLHHNVYELPLNPQNKFRFSVEDIHLDTDLMMINYPHNPSGQIATREQLEKLCQFCREHEIRLVNDAAYIALSYTKKSYALADVAVNFPGLSWMELFSTSKTIGNATDWRVGAAVGSPIFIDDFGKIKGKADSGFNAALATGALNAVENDKASIEKNTQKFKGRNTLLIDIAQSNGLRLAVKPQAGFFSTWLSPRYAFGEQMANAGEFNQRMIYETGVVGVPFHPYIRYAVCIDIEANADKIAAGFRKAQVSY